MRKLTLLFLLAFSLHLFAEPQHGVVYVVPNGTGTGASWSDALGDIQSAIGLARATSEARKDVWVAAGEFVITTAINIVDSVNVYGSFAGTETSLSERAKVSEGKAWEFSNPTILKGSGSRLVQTGGPLDEETVVDGFIMTDGNGAGSQTDGSGGAACLRPNMALQNCIIKNNSSEKAGGGVFMYPGGTVRNCLIKDNVHTTGGNGGGGIFCNTSSLGFTAYIENSEIMGNSSNVRGAGINVQGGSNTYISNCKIYNNSSVDGTTLKPGGAIYANSESNQIVNCVIYNNAGANAVYYNGGNMYNTNILKNVGGIYLAGKTINMFNNIIWGCATDNTNETPTSITGAANTLCTLSNNATYNPLSSENGWALTDNFEFSSNASNGEVIDPRPGTIGSGPRFVKVSNFIGVPVNEDQKANLDSVNWELNALSPCVNAGTVAPGVTVDFLGAMRPQGFPVDSAKYDIGAYELPYFLVVAGESETSKGEIYSSLGELLPENDTHGYPRGTGLELFFTSKSGEPIFKAYYTTSTDGGVTFTGDVVEFTADIDEEGFWRTTVKNSFKVTVQWEKPSSVPTLDATLIQCFPVANGIQIKGVNRGDQINVYNFSGMLMHQSIAGGDQVLVPVAKGMYIVRLAQGVQKVLVK